MSELLQVPAPSPLRSIRGGSAVLMVEVQERETVGYLVAAATLADASLIRFMSEHGDGLLHAAMRSSRVEQLGFPALPARDGSAGHGLRLCVGVDRTAEPGRPSSAEARAGTLRALGNRRSVAADFRYPGLVFPVGVGEPGQGSAFAAAIDLVALAGEPPVAAVCEIASPEDSEAPFADFARRHGLPLLPLGDAERPRSSPVSFSAESTLPRADTLWRSVAVLCGDGHEHLVLLLGDSADTSTLPLYLHRSCLFGDALGSLACPCGANLAAAIEAVTDRGRGAIVYLKSTEDRDVGSALRHRWREGDIQIAAEILAHLGIVNVELLLGHPRDAGGLRERGLLVREAADLPGHRAVSLGDGKGPSTRSSSPHSD